MRKSLKLSVATAVVSLVLAGTAFADFSPTFELKTSSTKINENPTLDIHLEFDEEDEEIGNFRMTLPKGFNVAGDEEIDNGSAPAGAPGILSGDEEIGSGTVAIRAGFDCRPGPEGAIPIGTEVTIPATIYEKARTDEEEDAGVHAVWLLDIEPANRVRLLISGSPKTGWVIEGAPTPSDNTCNPLTVDLSINGQSESGVGVVTNPTKPGKKVIVAEIFSQDSPDIAVFKTKFKYTK